MTPAPMRTSAHFVLIRKAIATFINLPIKRKQKMNKELKTSFNLFRKKHVIIMSMLNEQCPNVGTFCIYLNYYY